MVVDILAKYFISYKIRLSKKRALLLKETYYIICYSIAVSVSDSLQPYAPPGSLQVEEVSSMCDNKPWFLKITKKKIKVTNLTVSISLFPVILYNCLSVESLQVTG